MGVDRLTAPQSTHINYFLHSYRPFSNPRADSLNLSYKCHLLGEDHTAPMLSLPSHSAMHTHNQFLSVMTVVTILLLFYFIFLSVFPIRLLHADMFHDGSAPNSLIHPKFWHKPWPKKAPSI